MSAQPSTRLIHGDDHLRTTPGVTTDIATSTTYRYPPPTDPLHIQTAPPTFDPLGNDRYIYTRITNPNMTKAEKLVGELCCGQALVVSSGLGAGFLALLLLNPPAVAIRDGYHGCHKTIEVFQRVRKDMVRVCRSRVVHWLAGWHRLEAPLHSAARDGSLFLMDRDGEAHCPLCLLLSLLSHSASL